MTVLWYDRLEDFHAMVTDSLYKAQVTPDERTLLDTAATCWLIAGPEQVIVDKPGGRARAQAKLLSIFQRNPGSTAQPSASTGTRTTAACFRTCRP